MSLSLSPIVAQKEVAEQVPNDVQVEVLFPLKELRAIDLERIVPKRLSERQSTLKTVLINWPNM